MKFAKFKTAGILPAIGTFVLILSSCISREKSELNQEELYFKQDPPGKVAEIFAPGTVSVNGGYEFAVSFSPELDEMLFTREGEDESMSVYFSRLINGEWTTPEKANFTKGGKKNEFEAFVNPRGDRIYFAAYDSIFGDENIWYVDRTGDAWSEAKLLESPVNDDLVFYPNTASNGDLYYTSITKVKMYYAPNQNGEYPEVREVDIDYGIHGYISPEQDYMLVDARKNNDRNQDKDIQVCFRKEDGTWSKLMNLGPDVNSEFTETCPSISPDGKYIFFSRYDEELTGEGERRYSNIYWVSTAVIDSVRKSYENLSLLSDQLPTDSALVFAPGTVSTENFEFAITFNPQMDELFFTRRKPEEDNEIFSMKIVDGKWSEPELAFFTSDTGWDFEPHIDPTGDLLYFGSTRPLNDTAKASGMHQWLSKKGENGWSKPMPLENPFVDRFVMYITSAKNGNLYFTSSDEGAKPEDGGIYMATKESDLYPTVNRMNDEINSGKWIAHSYIAPDESYMIFDGEKDSGYGDCDLYISFNKDGSWTEPVNLGPMINTDQCEMCASVSPDGNYLFFHRGVYEDGEGSGDIYWADFDRVRELIVN